MALTPAQTRAFEADGFVIVRGCFTRGEVGALSAVCRREAPREGKPYFWGIPLADDRSIFNAICHSERVVGAIGALLQDDVTLFHRKLVMKDRESDASTGWQAGNAWEWHQDYGYWYSTELYPNMASCMVAVDRAHEHNGALNVLRGSHKLGRLAHSREQTAGEGVARSEMCADRDRVALAEASCERVVCEMEPGDALFFHCNTLHCSGPNASLGDPRWALICCYNSVQNAKASSRAAGGAQAAIPVAIERWPKTIAPAKEPPMRPAYCCPQGSGRGDPRAGQSRCISSLPQHDLLWIEPRCDPPEVTISLLGHVGLFAHRVGVSGSRDQGRRSALRRGGRGA